MRHLGVNLTKTPYLVLFVLVAVGFGTAYAAMTITLAGDVTITGDTTLQGELICTDCIDGAEIQAGSVGSSELASNSVGTSEIQGGAVESSEILDNSITADDIAPFAVDTSEIANDAVTSAKIASGAAIKTLSVSSQVLITSTNGALAFQTLEPTSYSSCFSVVVQFDSDNLGGNIDDNYSQVNISGNFWRLTADSTSTDDDVTCGARCVTWN